MTFDTYETEQLYEQIKARNNIDFTLYENIIFTAKDLLEFEESVKEHIKIMRERKD